MELNWKDFPDVVMNYLFVTRDSSGALLRIEGNRLPKGGRYFGPVRVYYDGDFYMFGLWFGHFCIYV